LDGTGNEGELHLVVPNSDINYQLGMQIYLGEGKFFHTKVIQYTPRYIIQNRLSEKVYIRQTSG